MTKAKFTMKNIRSAHKAHRLLAISLEPAPYKVDLWNAFFDCAQWEPFVLYTTDKDWSPDSGHDFQELPLMKFKHEVIPRTRIGSTITGIFKLCSLLFKWKPDLTIISGYIGFLPLFGIFCCIVFRKRYALWTDTFRNDFPLKRSSHISKYGRSILRWIIFRTASSLLVCGRDGRESAIIARCDRDKIHDFPYVVDAKRLFAATPEIIPSVCQKDINLSNTIIFFSGRMIPRKGLSDLLNALPLIADLDWILWIEGDGLILDHLIKESHQLGIFDRCRFLGFCQMSLHSWLLRNSNIVVVPSLSDPWGIVVDEGMQLGKAVISTNKTGSAIDRIDSGENGIIIAANDIRSLAQHLHTLIKDNEYRNALGSAALITARKFSPNSNVQTINNIYCEKRVSM